MWTHVCGPGDKMRIARTLKIFVYFSAKINLETETLVLGREKTKTETKFKIPQPPNTTSLLNFASARIFDVCHFYCYLLLEIQT